MKIQALTPTQFQVEAESLSCSRPGCSFVSNAGHEVGYPCLRCQSPLERITYLVDLESYTQNGKCGCFHFQCVLEPILRRLSPDDRRRERHRCKHIKMARRVAQSDAGLDCLLALLPNQEKQT